MKKFTFFWLGLLTALTMQAQIIHVPVDYPTIQLGINAATPGDTVLVAEGTYFEQINFLGKKPLMVASQFLLDGDTSHISKTIIDGSQIANSDTASVVYFINDEDSTSVISGFTIQGGKGTLWQYGKAGGGVFCYSGASILNNIIRNNQVIVTQNGAFGGGIFAFGGSAVHILNNTIRNNLVDCQSPGQYAAAGGGSFMGYSDGSRYTLNDNLIEENEARTSSSYLGLGGGIMFEEISVLCENNIFKHNISQHTTSIGGHGGAIHWYHCQEGSCIRNNSFISNTADCYGGAISVDKAVDSVELLIENNYFEGNSGRQGGAFCIWDSKFRLQNNVFSSNQAELQGGACSFQNASFVEEHMSMLINNSFYNNRSANGGAIRSSYAKPLILNSVFWNDTAISGPEIYLSAGDSVEIANTDIDMSLIFGGTVNNGGGNINADPLFMDTVYLIPFNWSPIVDAGNSQFTCIHGYTFEAPAYQINGYARPVGAGYDMGAYDHEAWGQGTEQITNDEFQMTTWPNPVCSSTTFTYNLKQTSMVTITVFNSFGQVVGEPVNGYQQKGEQKVVWNMESLPAGMYFYRIEAGEKSGTGKVVKM